MMQPVKRAPDRVAPSLKPAEYPAMRRSQSASKADLSRRADLVVGSGTPETVRRFGNLPRPESMRRLEQLAPKSDPPPRRLELGGSRGDLGRRPPDSPLGGSRGDLGRRPPDSPLGRPDPLGRTSSPRSDPASRWRPERCQSPGATSLTRSDSNSNGILNGLLKRFERPESKTVTETVQPGAASPNTALTQAQRQDSYQAMGSTQGAGSMSRGSSKEEEESSVWKLGMRSIASMLMDEDLPEPEMVSTDGVDFKLGRIQYALSYDFQSLTLSLRVIRAQGLPAKDVTGTSDPYVKILLLPDKKHKLLTKIKKRNLNPHWNECFVFEGWPHNKLLEKTLYLQVIDYDRFSRDDPIGEIYIPLNSVDLTQSASVWRFLQPCKDSRGKLGELLLSLCYQPNIGRLTVVAMKAKDLKAKDITGYSDPYVKVWLLFGKDKVEKKKTTIKKRTLNPIYNESFIFDVPWERIREASLEISVKDFDKVGRNELIGKIILSAKSGPMETRHWNDMVAKPRQQVAQWHLLKD